MNNNNLNNSNQLQILYKGITYLKIEYTFSSHCIWQESKIENLSTTNLTEIQNLLFIQQGYWLSLMYTPR